MTGQANSLDSDEKFTQIPITRYWIEYVKQKDDEEKTCLSTLT